MGRSASISLSICVLIVFSVLWKPAFTEDKCSAGCKGSSGSPSFLNGHKYNYAVEGVVSLFLTGAEKQETSAKLSGQVSVSALGNCAMVLRVLNLQIAGPDGKKYGKPDGIEKPVRFTIQDGKLGSDICAEEGDNQRSLNIKRAIISLLQNGQKQTNEVDVFGVCPTEVSSSQEAGALLVHRSRDLNRCAHREHGKHDLLTSIYNPHSEIKSTHVLQSSLNVESKVKSGIPEKVSATEEYLYMPFSVGQNGARARVETRLTLNGQSAGADAGAFTSVKSIIFENPHPTNTEHNNQANVLLALKSTVQSLQTHASSKSAGIFAQLVRIFRVTSKEDLLNVYSQIKAGGAVKDNNLAKKVYLDALLRSGTGDSIEVSLKLMKSKDLSPLEQKLVFLSLGNVRHASSEAVKAAAALLDQPDLPKEVYLGVGALAGAYCREHTCHGSNSQSEGIAALSQKLGAKLYNCKPKNKIEEDNVVAVLKGIRSIRHIENSLVDRLAHCVTDKDVKTRVKVAALEAFHADPCTPKLKKVAIDTMKNRLLDSEIRIKGYLAAIDCPCGKSANEIKNLLETETVQQVGRFISSSLRFIRASANPDKQLAKQHYGLIHTPNKFAVDDRKYSHYREVSYNIDSLGLGATAEQTVVFSQDSFLPRSAALNLTTELFGHSLNVLEFGGRQGNLDRVIEHFFGPKGFFRTNSRQEIYDVISKKYNDYENKVEGSLRTKRAVQQEINNFAKQVKGEALAFDNELDLDVYVKLFGTDAVFLSLGDDKGFNLDSIVDQLVKQLNVGVNGAKHFTQEVRSHLLFLDTELAYPTFVGLPLKLNLVGSATGRVEFGGSLDIRQIVKDPKNAKFDIQLVPSTNVEVAGSFVVDADFITTGLKVVTNMHTSTGGHLIAKILENGRGFDLQFAMPVDKQEVLTASNDLIFTTNEKGHQETEVALKIEGDRKEYTGCFDQLSSVVGLTFCGELSVPFSMTGPEASMSLQKLAARYPLTGPTKVSVHFEKNDLRGYHIKGLLHADNPERRSFELILEAEGTKSNRKTAFSGELINNSDEMTAKLSLQSPIKSASGQVSLITKSNEFAGMARFAYDAEEYYGRVGFSVQGNEQRSVYTPLIEYQMPGGQGKKVLNVEGQVIRESQAPAKPGNKYSFNGVKVNLPSGEKVQIDGYVANELRGFSGNVKAVKGEHNVVVEGVWDGPKISLDFQNTLNPYVNFKGDLYTVSEKGHYQNDLSLVYGPDFKSETNRITFSQNLKYQKVSANAYDVITKNKLVLPILQLDVKADGEIDPKKVVVDIEGSYENRKAKLELEARSGTKKSGDYNIKFETSLDDKGIKLFAKRDVDTQDKSNFENVLVIKPGGKYELSGVVNHRTKAQDMNVGAVGHLKVAANGKSDDIKFDISALSNTNVYSSHAKISMGSTDLVDFVMKLHRGNHPNGQIKLLLKDTFAANGQFKVNDNDGKGNGVLIVDFKKVGRKMKVDVQFLAKEPTYTADVNVLMDFEKDNKNKIHFTTNTRSKDGKLESKNQLVYGGKKTEVVLKKDLSGDFENGAFNGFLEFVLPDERVLSFKFDREIATKDDVVSGFVDAVISDAPKRGAAVSSLIYKSKVTNTNVEKDIIDYEGQVSLALQNGKTLDNTFYFKNNPAGDRFKFDFKSDVTGNILPKPASLQVTSDYSVSENTLDGDQKYRFKANYGDFSMDLDGVEEVKLLDEKDKKYSDQYTLHLNLPFEEAHDIKVTSNTMFLLPEDKDTVLEYTLSGGVQVNADSYKVDSTGKFGKSNGFSKIKVLVPHVDPFTLDASYKSDLQGDKKTGGVEIKTLYGKGKSASVAIDAARVSQQEYTLFVKALTPQDDLIKKLEISVLTKNPDGKTFNTNVMIDADGKVYKLDSLVEYSRTSPLFDVKYTCPIDGKTVRVYLKGSSLNEHNGRVDVKLENIKDFSLALTSDYTMNKELVAVKVDATSEKLNLKNYHLEISSKGSESGKRLEFNAKNDNKNLLSGSTSYISKQEGSKTIVEGSGSVKIRDEQKTATFKYIRELLTEGSEQGVEEFMNVGIGERSYVGESRVTNLEYKTSYVYCEEKKQCAHAEFNSKINVATPGLFQHTVNIGLDLRKLGFSPEFGLQMSSEVSEQKLPQYALDVHLNQEQSKYHLHAYSQPKNGLFPAGITLSLPKRVIAFESSLSYPDGKAMPFPIKGEAAFYLNKNTPNQKAAIRLLVDVTGSNTQHGAVAELGFSHPSLSKEALLKFRGNFAKPADYTYKVETSSTFSYPAFGSDRQARTFFEVNPRSVKLMIETPLVKVIDLEAKATLEKELQSADLTFSMLQGKPVEMHALARNFQVFEFSTGYSEQSGRKLSLVAHIEPEQRVDFSADIILPNEKKNMLHGALFIKDNMIKSDYGVSSDNFKYFLTALKSDVSNLGERVKQLAEKARVQVKNDIEKGTGVMDKLAKSYKVEMEKLRDELVNDKTLQEINQLFSSVVKSFAKVLDEIVQHSAALIEKITVTIKETSSKINKLYEEKLAPELKELYENISNVMTHYADAILSVVTHFTALVQDFIEKHKPELQELINTFTEIFKDLTRMLVARMRQLRVDFTEMLSAVVDQITNLPIVDMLKEKLQEFTVPEQALVFLAEINNAFKSVLPTEEAKNFADAVYGYIEKKLKQEKVDDVKEIRTLYEKAAVALTSFVQFVRSQLNEHGVPSLFNFNFVPFSLSPTQRMPVFGTWSFSPVNYILDLVRAFGEHPAPLDYLKAYRLRSFNPLDEVPAKLRAVVINGQHIFTFNGRHLTFPGTCRYVLAHDFADRNFTLLIQMANGSPKAITLEDKSGAVVEIKENGQAFLNGANHGYPVETGDTFAFRKPNGGLGIGTKYGVMVFCSPKLTVCYVEVSGFYMGKLRGLLGSGNNEPADDFKLPNGKLANSEADFGNAYRLTSGCAVVKTPDHSHHHQGHQNEACESVFGATSTLRPLFFVLDVAPFRQACAHATASSPDRAQEEACDLARGYAALATTGLLPAVLPPVCIQCSDSSTPRKFGEEYEITTPKKAADMIIAIETTKASAETYTTLVTPLVAQIVDTLKSRHIDDVRIYLVGITPKLPYAIMYDSDVKLKSAKINFDDETRYNKLFTPVNTNFKPLDDAQAILDKIITTFQREFGIYNYLAAYAELSQIPLRSDAVLGTLVLASERCIKAALPFQTMGANSQAAYVNSMNQANHLITITDLKIGAGKEESNVIGFDKNSVLLLGDKKHGKDTESIRSTLDIIPDSCIDFTLSTHGSVFSSNNFAKMNSGQKKQFINAAAQNIVDKMLQFQIKKDCYCVMTSTFTAKTVCTVDSKKELARRKK